MILNYDDFNELNEGLLGTYKDKIKNLIIFLNNNFDYNIIDYGNFTYGITITNKIFTDKNLLKILLSYIQNIGFYPSIMKIKYDDKLSSKMIFDKIELFNRLYPNDVYDDETKEKIDDKFKKKHKLKNITKNYNLLFLIIEPIYEKKYNDNGNNNPYPDKLYHLSPYIYEEDNLKNGLNPKSKCRKAYHPYRLYLFKDLKELPDLLIELKRNDLKNLRFDIKTKEEKLKMNELNYKEMKYNLYEITDKNLILNIDPYYQSGFYTTSNIKPNNIILLKQIL